MASSGNKGPEHVDISCILECDESAEQLAGNDSKLSDKDGSNHTHIYALIYGWIVIILQLWKFMVM
jgi:hypothetical protein